MIETLRGLIPSILMIVSPILITACGGMICERSGVVNIDCGFRSRSYGIVLRIFNMACPAFRFDYGIAYVAYSCVCFRIA